MANLFSLEGKNAWITGASYGIGFNIAKAFVAAGIKTIIFNDINDAALERGLANYKEAGIENVKGYVCDVTDENAVKALVEKIHAEVGNIDILVNNAGIIKRIPMHEMKRAEFQQVIDIDLVGPFIVSSAVIPEMMERKEGKIINICSMMSELGRETVSAYAAAKGGLKMLTRNICSEYGEYNIQCNGIGPGYIATPQTAPLRERQPDGSRHPFDSFICHSTASSAPRHLQAVGSILQNWVVPLCSSHHTLLTQSTDISSMLTAVSSPTSANSLSKKKNTKKRPELHFGVPALLFYYKNRLESISELSTWLELCNLLSSNTDLLLCQRIDTLTSWALVYTECTKANESNLVTSNECVLNSCYSSVKSLLCVNL